MAESISACRGRVAARLLIAFVIGGYCALLAWSADRHSPTFNEAGHLPAGIAHWRYQQFELYRVNPPLPRMVAAVPVLFCDPATRWSNYELDPLRRATIPMAIRFAEANGSRTFELFTIARLACIPFCLLGAWTCWRWAADLWGPAAGWTALLLWCVHPLLLGHGPLVMPDVPAAATGVFAAWQFQRWLHTGSWKRALVAGAALGVAELCKTTLLILVPLWWLTCLVWRSTDRHSRPVAGHRRITDIGQLTVQCLLAVYIINLGYGFRGSMQPLADFEFQSRLLSGAWRDDQPDVGNRFAGTHLASWPVPVPRDYLQGIDHQLTDFDLGGRSYLRGTWRERGWWYYHIYGLAVKTPTGTLLLMAAALGTTIVGGGWDNRWREEVVLMGHGVAILALVSSQTGFSNHVRYAIPALPFLLIWATKCMQRPVSMKPPFRLVAIVLVTSSAVSSLAAFPHSISYFNELAGGPRNGHEHLLDSNVAWGQDLLYLREWYDAHPEARPLQAALFGWIDPRTAGIVFELPPTGPSSPDQDVRSSERGPGPMPGWYAIDVNFLHGTPFPAPDGTGKWQRISPTGFNYEYFRRFEPVGHVGYSIHIYRISLADANRVRAELGMTRLSIAEQEASGSAKRLEQPGGEAFPMRTRRLGVWKLNVSLSEVLRFGLPWNATIQRDRKWSTATWDRAESESRPSASAR